MMDCMIARVSEVTHPYRIYKPLVSASVSLELPENSFPEYLTGRNQD